MGALAAMGRSLDLILYAWEASDGVKDFLTEEWRGAYYRKLLLFSVCEKD